MSKSSKLLARLRTKPPPSDFTWDELCTLLRSFGYEELKPGKTGGSRRKFYNRRIDRMINCHKPHPGKIVDKGCLADVLDHLKTNGLIEENNSEHS